MAGLRSPGVAALLVCTALQVLPAPGCSSVRPAAEGEEEDAREITITEIEGLALFDNLLPIPPDSVVRLYRQFDRKQFYRTFQPELEALSGLIDSLNALVPPPRRIDTLAIDHSFGGLGNAAVAGRTLYLSSSYFFLYGDRTVLRSVVFHEYGHVLLDGLTPAQRRELEAVWEELRVTALFYVFRDGEYSGNAWFGGHPEESPEELFASAFNIFNNRPDELRARLRFVEDRHRELVDRLRTVVGAQGLVLFE